MDNSEDAAARRAADQARLRKAKREAKLKDGAARLNKITGVNGSFREAEPPSTSETFGPETPPEEEPRLSEHFYEPARRPGFEQDDGTPSAGDGQTRVNDVLSQMMLSGFGGTPPGATPPAGMQGAAAVDPQDPFAGAADDPFLKMLLSQLGGMPGSGAGGAGAAGGAGQNPLAALLQQAQQGQQGNAAAGQEKGAATSGSKPLTIWRVVHALFALALVLTIFVHTTFSFTRLEREQDVALAGGSRVSADADAAEWAGARDAEREWLAKVFWAWAATEAALLATRFLAVDNGAGAGGGMMAMAVGALSMFLPPLVVGTAKVAVRYSRWVLAIRQDLAVVVFALGISAWVRGGHLLG